MRASRGGVVARPAGPIKRVNSPSRRREEKKKTSGMRYRLWRVRVLVRNREEEAKKKKRTSLLGTDDTSLTSPPFPARWWRWQCLTDSWNERHANHMFATSPVIKNNKPSHEKRGVKVGTRLKRIFQSSLRKREKTERIKNLCVTKTNEEKKKKN